MPRYTRDQTTLYFPLPTKDVDDNNLLVITSASTPYYLIVDPIGARLFI